jgi:Holliday junction resolvase RusA-like endonuclease
MNFILNFENGLPKGTAQQKGERVIIKNGRPVILHYKKNSVESARMEFVLKLKKYRPAKPIAGPVRLLVGLYFDVKRKELWKQYKTTRPDADGYLKEFLDAMQEAGFFEDDAQVVDLHIIKRYAERGSIYVDLEEIKT